MHMRRWLLKQVMDSLGDTAFAAVSLVVGFVLLVVLLWYDWEPTWLLNLNLSLVHWVTSLLPSIGGRIEFLLRLFGIDHILFFTELWAFVALILRVVGLGFRLLMAPWKKSRRRN